MLGDFSNLNIKTLLSINEQNDFIDQKINYLNLK